MSLEKDNGFQNPLGVFWFSGAITCMMGYLIVRTFIADDPQQWFEWVMFVSGAANTWFLAKDRKKEKELNHEGE